LQPQQAIDVIMPHPVDLAAGHLGGNPPASMMEAGLRSAEFHGVTKCTQSITHSLMSVSGPRRPNSVEQKLVGRVHQPVYGALGQGSVPKK
jgi:hypothetical protein